MSFKETPKTKGTSGVAIMDDTTETRDTAVTTDMVERTEITAEKDAVKKVIVAVIATSEPSATTPIRIATVGFMVMSPIQDITATPAPKAIKKKTPMQTCKVNHRCNVLDMEGVMNKVKINLKICYPNPLSSHYPTQVGLLYFYHRV